MSGFFSCFLLNWFLGTFAGWGTESPTPEICTRGKPKFELYPSKRLRSHEDIRLNGGSPMSASPKGTYFFKKVIFLLLYAPQLAIARSWSRGGDEGIQKSEVRMTTGEGRILSHPGCQNINLLAFSVLINNGELIYPTMLTLESKCLPIPQPQLDYKSTRQLWKL